MATIVPTLSRGDEVELVSVRNIPVRGYDRFAIGDRGVVRDVHTSEGVELYEVCFGIKSLVCTAAMIRLAPTI